MSTKTIEQLEAELAEARAKITALEAKPEIKPTDLEARIKKIQAASVDLDVATEAAKAQIAHEAWLAAEEAKQAAAEEAKQAAAEEAKANKADKKGAK